MALDKSKVKLGIAPIGWTNDDMPDLGGEIPFEQCVSEMALAGYTGCEVGNKFPKHDPELLRRKLSVRGLTICNQWFSAFFTSKPFSETIEAFKDHCDFLYSMGARVVGASEQGNSIQGRLDLPVLKDKPVYSDEEWELVARGFNEMGRIARDKGMTLTCHHHMGTGVQTEEEVGRFMDSTDPELVFLLHDTGHFVFAGVDPVKMLDKYAKRIKHVHLKGVRDKTFTRVKAEGFSFLDAVRAGVFTVPGDGDFDFAPIYQKLGEIGYEGWIVVEAEQDPALANPFEYALIAREDIRKHTGL